VLFVTEKQPTSIAIAWSKPVSGREFHPLKFSKLHGALLRQLSVRAQIQRKPSNNFAATVRTMNVATKQQRAVISGFVQGFRS